MLGLFSCRGKGRWAGAGNRGVEHIVYVCVPFRAHCLCYLMKKDWDWRCMCHVWVRTEMCTEVWWGNLKDREHFEDLGVDGKIIQCVRKVAVH
jgi:hypothetical protein